MEGTDYVDLLAEQLVEYREVPMESMETALGMFRLNLLQLEMELIQKPDDQDPENLLEILIGIGLTAARAAQDRVLPQLTD